MNFANRKRKDGSWSYFAERSEGGKRRRHTFENCHTQKVSDLAFGEFNLRHARGPGRRYLAEFDPRIPLHFIIACRI